MNIVLIGYRGSGKTTAGRLLAERLNRAFVDCDDLIIAAAGGKPIRDIFFQDGEKHFRDVETRAIEEISRRREHVIALGGGALGREENRLLISRSSSHVIYLRCDPQILLQRIQNDAGTSDNRPSLTKFGGGMEEITLLLGQREPIYTATMTREIDVSHLTPAQVVEQIVGLL